MKMFSPMGVSIGAAMNHENLDLGKFGASYVYNVLEKGNLLGHFSNLMGKSQ